MSENEKRTAERISKEAEKNPLIYLSTTRQENIVHAYIIIKILQKEIKSREENARVVALDALKQMQETGAFSYPKNYYYIHLLDLRGQKDDDVYKAFTHSFYEVHRACVPQLAKTILADETLLREVIDCVS